MSIYEKISSGAYNPKCKCPLSGRLTTEEYAQYAYESGVLERQFWADLFAECKVDAGDPFIQRMQCVAWRHGYRYDNVVLVFMDMMPLWELYAEKGAR